MTNLSINRSETQYNCSIPPALMKILKIFQYTGADVQKIATSVNLELANQAQIELNQL